MTEEAKTAPAPLTNEQKAMRAFVRACEGSIMNTETITANFEKGARVHPLAEKPATERRFDLVLTWEDTEINDVADHFIDLLHKQNRIMMAMGSDRFVKWAEMEDGDNVEMSFSALSEKRERETQKVKKEAVTAKLKAGTITKEEAYIELAAILNINLEDEED